MNSLKIERQNGNVPKSVAGEDHVSGFIAYLAEAEIPDGFKTEHVQAVSTINTAEKLGITDTANSWSVKVLHYQLSEIFRINPSISLYVGIFTKPTDYKFTEIKTVQNFANGRIRQMALWCGDKAFDADDLTAIQGVADALDAENAPLSILYAPQVTAIGELPTNVAGANQYRTSVVIAQAGSGIAAELYAAEANQTAKASVSAVGVVLGLVSAAAVHQSIGWVKNFPTGVNVPAFSDGTLYRDIDKALIEQLDAGRYLFFVTHVGQAGSYMNDSHTMDSAISDYAMIENVRTMDKAVRGIRTYLVPELGGNIYVDAETGKMQAYSISHLETTANKALEDMEKAGELSGYRVEIDPDQNILSTSEVEIIIRQVAVGVMRKIKVKIGFAQTA
ncbi:DUF2586 family protein [uncultured Rikenella sp.]|uniref:DUF2586 family protein n=1 Tax=uncultured Rikenella sp. TaxID=368003 RepID=UPI0025D84DA4|nr:DUF2586 family protein [uncultured Rikenella sp.]